MRMRPPPLLEKRRVNTTARCPKVVIKKKISKSAKSTNQSGFCLTKSEMFSKILSDVNVFSRFSKVVGANFFEFWIGF